MISPGEKGITQRESERESERKVERVNKMLTFFLFGFSISHLSCGRNETLYASLTRAGSAIVLVLVLVARAHVLSINHECAEGAAGGGGRGIHN